MNTARGASAMHLLHHLSQGQEAQSVEQISTRLGWSAVQVHARLIALQGRHWVASPGGNVWVVTDKGHAASAARSPVGPSGKHAKGRELRMRIWRALRCLVKASLDDLLPLVAVAEPSAHLRRGIQRYLRVLERAGYAQRYGTYGNYRWLLVQNTGPKAPTWGERGQQFCDHNTGQIFCPLKPRKEKTP